MELEQQALALPRKERVALAQALYGSLDAQLRAEVRDRFLRLSPSPAEVKDLPELSAEERAAREKILLETIEGWLEGPSKEMTVEDWDEVRQTRPGDVDPSSWAVPPGWTPKSA